MLGEVDDLTAFADDVRHDGIKHVVLLGMGGSSLGPEVLSQCFGGRDGFPELIVLDSTLPSRIRTVLETIDPARTLFLVSSKSGATIEPNMLYKLFRSLVEDAVGPAEAGKSFVAVTDPGTPLDDLAERDGFRRTFRNPSDIGGRYSVLSYFGLVPAALIGSDLRTLLKRAIAMRSVCGPEVRASANPGAWLGALIGGLARSGRDKLTILTSPSLTPFGPWVEQLAAESLGKNGIGVVPIVGEPPVAPELYGDDRHFVYLKLAGEDSDVDTLAEDLALHRHPVIRYELEDLSELGAEFYRWEFAIATAAAVMGVNPFDQPDVQRAKDLSRHALDRFESDGLAPDLSPCGSPSALVATAKQGDYIAIVAYVEQTAETDRALNRLRSAITSQYRVPTTLGYGPRYLHSTGQLHKGGPDSVAVLMLTAPHASDIEIPGEKYTFGVLADAQAASDLEALKIAGRRAVNVALDGNQAYAATGIAALAERL